MTEHHHPVARTRRIAVGGLILALVLGLGLWWALARTGANHEAGDAEASETAAASADPSHPSAQASASPQPSAPATAIADPEAPKDSFTDAPAPKDAEPQALDAALAAQEEAAGKQAQETEDSADAGEADPEESAPGAQELAQHLSGSALEEALAELSEAQANGWRIEGRPRVVGQPRMRTLEHDGAPARQLAVCLDSSDVKVLDQAGKTLGTGSGPERVLNLYTLVQQDGTWMVAEHALPADTAC
ncbi:hypothetical protein I6H58_03335 [Rothia kristinae]|uniref:ARC6 IMS domain-containing protein n=1 Tax=Rothia kristinae TaxID=37923 RepID=A0A7T4MUS0_9MICC|nr:hypothetical protein [Rothia kristinae]QQC59996.1 hypothetical protein I6H58_03335 [Rothia kristinae]